MKIFASNFTDRLITGAILEKNAKFGLMAGVMKGSRDLLLKFWDPSISRERLKLETSNLACI